MSRRNYRQRRVDSIGYAGNIEDGNVQGSDSVLFHGSTSSVPIRNASTKSTAIGSSLIIQNGALAIAFKGNRRRIPLPPKFGQVVERFDYPFRVITSNETLGADRAEFTFPGNLAQNGNVLGFSSFSRGTTDYNVAWNVGGSFVIVGRNPSTITPQLLGYTFRGNNFFTDGVPVGGTEGFSPSTGSLTPANNVALSTVTGTPVEVLGPVLQIGFWQLGSQQNGTFPETYTVTQSIDRTRIFTGTATIPDQTFRETDNYTAGTGSSGAGAPSSCIEEEAAQGILWTGPNGTAPGRTRTTRSSWERPLSSALTQIGFISDGVETITNRTNTFRQSSVTEESVSIQPRQWSVTAGCRGTGIISFVPRIFFTTTLIDPAVVTAQGSHNNTRESTSAGSVQILPNYSIPINNFYRQTDTDTVPAYNPLTQQRQQTSIIDIERSERSITLGFYDEEAQSCIFRDQLFTSETHYSRFAVSDVEYNLSVNSSTYAPQSLPFAAGTGAPSLNFVSSGTGSRVTTTDTVDRLKGARSGQPDVDFGERAGTVRAISATSFPESFFLSAQVGNTFIANTIVTAQRPVSFSLNLPSSNQLADEVVTLRTILTPEEQILNRQFIVQRQFFPNPAFHTLVCTAIAIGPNLNGAYSSINTTQRHSTTFRVDEIHMNSLHTPVTLNSTTEVWRFAHVSDLFFGIPIDRRRWTILPSDDPDVFWDIWAANGRPTPSSRTATYSQGRVMMDGSIQWDFTPIEGDYQPHPSSGAVFAKVHPKV